MSRPGKFSSANVFIASLQNSVGKSESNPGLRLGSLPRRCSVKRFRQRDGLEHGLGLVHGLLIFTFRRGIVDPAAAGLHESASVLDEGSANGNAAIEVAIKGKIA